MMKYKIFAIILLIFSLAGCGLFESNKVTNITVEVDKVLAIGEYSYIEASVNVKNYKGELRYSSSNDEVFIIDEDYILAIAPGEAELIVTYIEDGREDLVKKVLIKVVDVELEAIIITGITNMIVDSTQRLNISTTPSNASDLVTWESSNTEVATITEEGLVYALSIGVTDITARSIENNEIFYTFRINVSFESPNDFELTGLNQVDLGREVEYIALFNGLNINHLFLWSTSDPEVASISALGILTSYKTGVVTITVRSKHDQNVVKTLVVEIVEASFVYTQSKVLVLNRTNGYVELLNVGLTKIDNNTKIYKLTKAKEKIASSINELYVGMENIYVRYNLEDNSINEIIIDGEVGFSNIRVGIRKSINDISDDSTRYHNEVSLTLYRGSRIQTFDGLDVVNASPLSKLTFSIVSGKIVLKDEEGILLETAKRIIVIPSDANEAIKINGISRGSNTIYSGNLEVSLDSGRLLVVNDVNLEEYLYKVVPSEMPASYNKEALKAQAIAARTYAYKDILNRTYEKYGYTVDDSVQSQVYNNVNAQVNTTNAVDETKGLIMMHGNLLVNAYYYSTSAGITASAHEVWISDDNLNPNVIPYLMGQNHTTDHNNNPISFDYTDEADMLRFFKLVDVVTPDNQITFHRWRTTFTKAKLTTTISKNIINTYNSTPNLVQTLEGSKFVSKPITNFGEVTNVYVGKRGESGVVIELIVETTTNTYKIINQYNIRFTIKPGDAGVSNETRSANSPYYSVYGSNLILFSGFFAIEEVNGVFTFYGGGNGHGVGMSQNGANTLGANGKNFEEILNSYYSDIDLVDITYDYESLMNFENYFN